MSFLCSKLASLLLPQTPRLSPGNANPPPSPLPPWSSGFSTLGGAREKWTPLVASHTVGEVGCLLTCSPSPLQDELWDWGRTFLTLGCNTLGDGDTAFVRLFLLSPPMCTNLGFVCLFVVDIFGPKRVLEYLPGNLYFHKCSLIYEWLSSLQGLLDCRTMEAGAGSWATAGFPGGTEVCQPMYALVYDAGSNSSLKETFVWEWLLNFVVEAGSKTWGTSYAAMMLMSLLTVTSHFSTPTSVTFFLSPEANWGGIFIIPLSKKRIKC